MIRLGRCVHCFRPVLAAAISVLTFGVVQAQESKPNILLIVADDVGYGDLGPYGGGEGRGMPTPSLDRLAKDGMTFFSFYAQPSCTPGRAAILTGRIPNRSGMTTVAFQGQGGGLPKAEWTLGSVLKTAGYRTFFTGKWHLGEADYALPKRTAMTLWSIACSITATRTPMATRLGFRTWIRSCTADVRPRDQRLALGQGR